VGWEAGATVARFSTDSQFDYHEWFAGVHGDALETRGCTIHPTISAAACERHTVN
jgi:hypothetical protein